MPVNTKLDEKLNLSVDDSTTFKCHYNIVHQFESNDT